MLFINVGLILLKEQPIERVEDIQPLFFIYRRSLYVQEPLNDCCLVGKSSALLLMKHIAFRPGDRISGWIIYILVTL